MKNSFVSLLVAITAVVLVSGCAWSVGGGHKSEIVQPTLGQQLVDLKRARDAGAINEFEYETQRARLLGGR